MVKDFVVNITRATTAVAQKGFGLMLILDDTKEHPYTIYGSIADLAADYDSQTEVYKIAQSIFSQGLSEVAVYGEVISTTAGYTDALDALTLENDAWFGLACVDNSDSTIAALETWIGGKEKIYAVTSRNKSIAGTSNYALIAYHQDKYLAEALLAYMVKIEIGSATAKFKQLEGMTASDVNLTEFTTLIDNNIIVYVEKYGVLQTANGTMAGGEYLDVILGELWIKARMEEDLASLSLRTPKIPYTNQGIALLIDIASTRLRIAANQGIVALDDAGNPQFTVTFIPKEEVPLNDIANRTYDFVRWEATLAGAIESGVINGTLTL